MNRERDRTTASDPDATAGPTQPPSQARPAGTANPRPPAGGHTGVSGRPGKGRRGDAVFLAVSRGSGVTVLAIMAAVATFLTYRTVIALSHDDGNFLTTFEWHTNGDPPVFGIAVLAYGTAVSSAVAMVLAVPVAVCVALFLVHYAPRVLAGPLAYLIDLLAAVPSVVYGLWGALFLVPQLNGYYAWLDRYLGWTGVLGYQGGAARSLFTVGVLLAIMILPIVTSVSREVFRQVPTAHQEAALALGATRWEMIRLSVLPFGRSGVLSAAMLGLGRALGETMAVTTVLSTSFDIKPSLLDAGGGTFAQNIASGFKEATDVDGSVSRDALIASGLVLFVITLLVNGTARLVIARRRRRMGAGA